MSVHPGKQVPASRRPSKMLGIARRASRYLTRRYRTTNLHPEKCQQVKQIKIDSVGSIRASATATSSTNRATKATPADTVTVIVTRLAGTKINTTTVVIETAATRAHNRVPRYATK